MVDCLSRFTSTITNLFDIIWHLGVRHQVAAIRVRRQETRMNRKPFAVVLCAMLFALCSSVQAQQATKIPRIGYLTVASLSSNVARIEAFRRGLRELGYVEGKNVVIAWRSAEGKFERQDELAAELVQLKVDVIVSSGPTMTRAAKESTATIPIVMAFDSDPVGNHALVLGAR